MYINNKLFYFKTTLSELHFQYNSDQISYIITDEKFYILFANNVFLSRVENDFLLKNRTDILLNNLKNIQKKIYPVSKEIFESNGKKSSIDLCETMIIDSLNTDNVDDILKVAESINSAKVIKACKTFKN